MRISTFAKATTKQNKTWKANKHKTTTLPNLNANIFLSKSHIILLEELELFISLEFWLNSSEIKHREMNYKTLWTSVTFPLLNSSNVDFVTGVEEVLVGFGWLDFKPCIGIATAEIKQSKVKSAWLKRNTSFRL